MKKLIIPFLIVIAFSCENIPDQLPPKNDWKERYVDSGTLAGHSGGITYLSAYSDIYSLNESKTLPLTVTVSIRNPNLSDTIFIENADYYNTDGVIVKNYLQKPIYVTPMETVEIVISRLETDGGSGANFMFNWKANKDQYDPIFEAVMIHAYGGNYGLSFTTQGVLLERSMQDL